MRARISFPALTLTLLVRLTVANKRQISLLIIYHLICHKPILPSASTLTWSHLWKLISPRCYSYLSYTLLVFQTLLFVVVIVVLKDFPRSSLLNPRGVNTRSHELNSFHTDICCHRINLQSFSYVALLSRNTNIYHKSFYKSRKNNDDQSLFFYATNRHYKLF